MPTQRPADELATAIRDQLLVWLHEDSLRVMLARPALSPPAGVVVTPVDEPLLKARRGRRVAGNVVTWPRLGLEAKPNPFLAFVLDGTVDLSVGVTEGMVADSNEPASHGVYHARMPQGSLLIYPQNVPNPDGLRPHWEGDEVQPDSTVLWVDVLPEGALLHTCHTRDGKHAQGSIRFVFDPRLPTLYDVFVEELELEPGTELVSVALRFFLLRMLRSLMVQDAAPADTRILFRDIQPNDRFFDEACRSRHLASSSAVKRARDFIHGRLNLKLTVAIVAKHTHVSPGHLNRLFRTDLQMSVMEYVYEQRLETAKSLLAHTTLPVNVVGKNVGLSNSAYFSRMFRERTGETPQEFRNRQPKTQLR